MPLDTFKTYNELNEKQIVFNKGKRFGQAVFVAGGAGSGKGFAIQNFLDSSKFKIRDIDSYKSALISLDQIASDAGKKTKQKGINAKEKYGLELRNFKMNNPKDVFMLHKLAKEIGLDKKSLNLLLGNAKNPETLPQRPGSLTIAKGKSAFPGLSLKTSATAGPTTPTFCLS